MIERVGHKSPQATDNHEPIAPKHDDEHPKSNSAAAPSGPSPLSTSLAGQAKELRTRAAHAAMSGLARELPGHGVDLDSLARKVASGSGSMAQAQNQARYAFVRAALGHAPRLADKAIQIRLRGLDGNSRKIVELELSRSKTTGLARYAEAERALSKLAGFDRQERGDVRGIMAAGASLSEAAAAEKRDLRWAKAHVTSKPSVPSMTRQRNDSIASLRSQAATMKRYSTAMNQLYRSVPTVDRVAELSVAAVGLHGAMGDAVFDAARAAGTASSEPLRESAHAVQTNVGRLRGDLTRKIDEVRGKYLSFCRTYADYVKENHAAQRAVADTDAAGSLQHITQMNALAKELKHSIEELTPLAKELTELDHELDHDVVHGAVHVLVSAVLVGLGGAPGEHAVKAVASHAGKTASHVAGEIYEQGVHAAATHVVTQGALSGKSGEH